MEIIKPSILPGFLELSPKDQKVFDEMRKIIEDNFIKYGFINIDTPLIEKEEILLAKGGGETTKQIYRIDKESTKQALRFDLTVSLARYVSMHAHDLSFPFRRYQIGKVYRGERNQKGRYREFYQCDIDIVGNDKLSIINDGEIPSVIYNIFKDLGFEDILFRINNRKLLQGFLEFVGVNKFEEVLRSIDKLEKIGIEKTILELKKSDINDYEIEKILDFISSSDSNEKTIEKLNNLDINNEIFTQGRNELLEVYKYMQAFGIPTENIKIDLTITRGLDYYTGTVYETFLKGYESIGSVCSGGRYDDLANNFSKQKYPGVGLSIGLSRLYYQLNEANLLNNLENINSPLIVIPMGDDVIDYGIEIVNELRASGFVSQIYLESGKVKKKFSYSDSIGVETAIIIGGDEKEKQEVTVKNFISGSQETISKDNLIDFLEEK